jgi:hypothetical protein
MKGSVEKYIWSDKKELVVKLRTSELRENIILDHNC